MRSIAKAATHLNLTQSAASKAIVQLERSLGVRLLDRSTRGVAPTPYGRVLIKRGVAIFDELRQGMKISCIEEVAYHKGFITAAELEKLARAAPSDYGHYLLQVLEQPPQFLSMAGRSVAGDRPPA